MPWTMKVKSRCRRMLTGAPPLAERRASRPRRRQPEGRRWHRRPGRPRGRGWGGGASGGRPLDLLDRPPRCLPHRDRAVAVLDPVALEDLEALLLPGARDAEDRDRLGRVLAELEAGLDHAPRDDVH